MPRFCFVIDDGSGHPQREPVDLPDITTAKAQAVTLTGEMLKSIDGSLWQESDWRIDVTDEAGLILCAIMVHGVEAGAISR